jgi:hypothetical protein
VLDSIFLYPSIPGTDLISFILTSNNERSRDVDEKGAFLKAKECSLKATMHPYEYKSGFFCFGYSRT